jgi:hypothetical protein
METNLLGGLNILNNLGPVRPPGFLKFEQVARLGRGSREADHIFRQQILNLFVELAVGWMWNFELGWVGSGNTFVENRFPEDWRYERCLGISGHGCIPFVEFVTVSCAGLRLPPRNNWITQELRTRRTRYFLGIGRTIQSEPGWSNQIVEQDRLT